MKNLSTGTGLCIAGLCAVAFPFAQKLANVDSEAHAGVQTSAMTAVASTATAQVTPTIVWMGVSNLAGTAYVDNLYRLWSDGRLEMRCVYYSYDCSAAPGSSEWREVAPPPGGIGFACRADLDGNRVIDGADLGIVLSNWGPQPPCAPAASFPCFSISGGNLRN
jgi:hypothetical protein